MEIKQRSNPLVRALQEDCRGTPKALAKGANLAKIQILFVRKDFRDYALAANLAQINDLFLEADVGD